MQTLRRALPLTAHARRPLTVALPISLAGTNLSVTGVFYAGEKNGLMCRLDVGGERDEPAVVMVPLTQLAFNRRHPIAQEIAAYRKRRTQAPGVTGHDGT